MNPQTQVAYLAASLAELDRALSHLLYSANTCADLPPDEPTPTEEVLARIEAFTSRFARVVNLMSKRVLRAISCVAFCSKNSKAPSSRLCAPSRPLRLRGSISSLPHRRSQSDATSHSKSKNPLPLRLGGSNSTLPLQIMRPPVQLQKLETLMASMGAG